MYIRAALILLSKVSQHYPVRAAEGHHLLNILKELQQRETERVDLQLMAKSLHPMLHRRAAEWEGVPKPIARVSSTESLSAAKRVSDKGAAEAAAGDEDPTGTAAAQPEKSKSAPKRGSAVSDPPSAGNASRSSSAASGDNAADRPPKDSPSARGDTHKRRDAASGATADRYERDSNRKDASAAETGKRQRDAGGASAAEMGSGDGRGGDARGGDTRGGDTRGGDSRSADGNARRKGAGVEGGSARVAGNNRDTGARSGDANNAGTRSESGKQGRELNPREVDRDGRDGQRNSTGGNSADGGNGPPAGGLRGGKADASSIPRLQSRDKDFRSEPPHAPNSSGSAGGRDFGRDGGKDARFVDRPPYDRDSKHMQSMASGVKRNRDNDYVGSAEGGIAAVGARRSSAGGAAAEPAAKMRRGPGGNAEKVSSGSSTKSSSLILTAVALAEAKHAETESVNHLLAFKNSTRSTGPQHAPTGPGERIAPLCDYLSHVILYF